MLDETLDIRITSIADTLYVALSGELDLNTAEEMSAVQERVREAMLTAVELDLRGIGFIDSVGLLQIARLYRAARARLAPLTVYVQDGSHVQQILRLIGAGDLFEVVTGPGPTAFPSS